MLKPPNHTRPLLTLAALAAIAIGASGCGTSTADVERGRVLFIQRCGGCHALAQAGTAQGVGPDLDEAFAAARASGQDGDTVAGVVRAQVENPRPSTANPAVSMPAGLVSGQDLEDVAAYMARYAGVPGATPPRVPGGPGAQVFASRGCGGCHTLAAANSGGRVGPDLDQVLPGQSLAMIHESIVDPNKAIAKGFPANVMPSNYGEIITPEELNQLVLFLSESTGGGKGRSKSKGG
ncbi:MAG TPA: c-type cytochrome [Solirubrobacterales bacterium]|nr:c-type cytochrome [Solirubrobacterales bacterium]